MIKKKKFLEKNIVADLIELLGEELDMEAEFNDLDNANKEKVQTGPAASQFCIRNPRWGKSNILRPCKLLFCIGIFQNCTNFGVSLFSGNLLKGYPHSLCSLDS